MNMYTKLFESQAQLIKALAHPRRLEIIHLIGFQELVVSDIFRMLDLPQANISQHLKILLEESVLKNRKQGRQVFYSLADQRFLEISQLLRNIMIDQSKGGSWSLWLEQNPDLLIPTYLDPVCGMQVSVFSAGDSCHIDDQVYFFCASGCKRLFLENMSVDSKANSNSAGKDN